MSECIVWTGTFHNGYPMQGALLAHRVAYEAAREPIPVGHVVHHTCDNKACVNPSHLETMTPREHMLLHRNWERSHEARKSQTHCKHGHPLDGLRRVDGRPRRYCRTCHNADTRRGHARRRLQQVLPQTPGFAEAVTRDESPAPEVDELSAELEPVIEESDG